MKLPTLLKKARGCQACAAHLPGPPHPLLQGDTESRVLVIGQAPGIVAHQSGVPWDDRSGQRLRAWLGTTDEQFYDPKQVALMPMGFCYPGKGRSGDAPPRPECEPLWHPPLLEAFVNVKLTVYLGKYAFARYLADEFSTITEAAHGYHKMLPKRIALPHPSPRNNLWLKKHPWFEADVLPQLRRRVCAVLAL